VQKSQKKKEKLEQLHKMVGLCQKHTMFFLEDITKIAGSD